MLPYSSNQYGGFGGGYGRRKGVLNSQSTILGVAAMVILASLGFALYSSTRASSALASKATLARELDHVRAELDSVKGKLSTRNAEYEQLQLANSHSQRRLTELTSQLQRKEADVISKDQTLKQQQSEREQAEQHRNAREAELTKMVEDLRSELLNSDGVIDSLERKMSQMETAHNAREADWHKLASTWIKYEEDLHEQYRKCTEEVARLKNLTTPQPTTNAPLPEAEPKLRPEADFGHINVAIPEHHAHHFDPIPATATQLPPGVQRTTGAAGPAGGPSDDLPLPEAKIRESIAQMTNGKLGGPPGQQAEGTVPAGQEHEAPTPVSSHHDDHYDHHGDFAHNGDFHHYEQYHGHYDSYDPLDQYWMHDAHGDWNADEGYTTSTHAGDHSTHGEHHDPHGKHHDPHGGHHDPYAGHHDPYAGHHDQHGGHGQHDPYAGQHHQEYRKEPPQYDHHHDNYHHHDPHGARYKYHEQAHHQHEWQQHHQVGRAIGSHGGGGDAHHHEHVPPAMGGMEWHPGVPHAQHAPAWHSTHAAPSGHDAWQGHTQSHQPYHGQQHSEEKH